MADGRVVISIQSPDDPPESVTPLLEEIDAHSRAELGLDCPPLNLEAGLWAARLLYQLCQFTVCRDLGEDRVVAGCRKPCPTGRGPEADWSVDLVLRHLPTLTRYASHLSQADPLVRELKTIATAWPLSSVGMAGLSGVTLESFIGHPALRRLYADRILAARDYSRLGDRRVDDLLRADLGLHRELAPDLMSRLEAPAPTASPVSVEKPS